MRLLIVSYYFPPYNTIGAVRVSKTARLLAQWGHDVRVLCADDQPLQPTLDVELDEACITRTPWWNVNAPVEHLLGGRQRVAAQGFTLKQGSSSFVGKLGRLYKSAVNFPDAQIGWLPYAVRAGERLLRDWNAEVILASGLPATVLCVASRLAKRFNLPWVAELRDLWTLAGSYDEPWWRRWLETRLERAVLSTARGMVTVSQPLADELQRAYRCPTAVVLNGCDPHDFERARALPGEASSATVEPRLKITYTGMIYALRRDPRPLFAALQLLGDDAKQIHVEFVGRYLHEVQRQAAEFGLAECVTVRESIPYLEALRLQQQSDVNLLLLDPDVRQQGVYTGKLFEYLGARRPILALGPRETVAGQLIAERRAGCVSLDRVELAAQLRRWLAEKRALGHVAPLDATVIDGLTRHDQVRRLEAFLNTLLHGQASQRQAA